MIDVTPYPNDFQRPLPGTGENIVFMFDCDAEPVEVGGRVLPRKSRFYALSSDGHLLEHVRQQASQEDEEYSRLLAGAEELR